MPSYTAQLILSEPTHASPAAMYKNGDIVAIYDLINEKPNPNGRLCFLHVLNTPDNMTTENLKSELARYVRNSASLDKEITQKSAWSVDFKQLDINELTEKKELTIDWSLARDCFIRKFDSKTGGQFYDEKFT